MSKTKLKCEYCSNLITEKDLKCPNCGANCSKVIEKYKEEKEAEEKEIRDKQRAEAEKIAKKAAKTFGIFSLIPIIMFIVVAGIIVTSFFTFRSSTRSNTDSFFEEEKEEKQQQVTVGYQETAKTKDANITLDSYELYEYKSNEFPDQYNTKEGYQKIAFHLKIENNKDETVNTSFNFKYSMKADDYKVEEAEYKTGMFTYPSPGKDSYPSIKYVEIAPKETLQGYVNFTVPTSAKEIKLRVGEYVTIKMNNPAYKG